VHLYDECFRANSSSFLRFVLVYMDLVASRETEGTFTWGNTMNTVCTSEPLAASEG